MLRIEELSKSWSGFALQQISLDVESGEYLVILGETGAGKTLLLQTIMGFHEPDQGRILLDGKDITRVPTEKRNFGYVPQDCLLFPNMTVKKNIEFGLKMRHRNEQERTRKVKEIVGLLRLEHLVDSKPLTLSGGEKQRVALARGLVVEPHVLLLDEPLGSIDAVTRMELRSELKRIHRSLLTTIIHVTHDQTEAFGVAEKIAIMSAGRILQVGEANEVFESPKGAPVARFIGYENIFDGTVVKNEEGSSLVDIGGPVIRVSGNLGSARYKVGIRPEDVTIHRNRDDFYGSNTLRGVIKDYTGLGPFVSVTVDIGLSVKATIPRRSFLELSLRTDEEVWVTLRETAVKLLERA